MTSLPRTQQRLVSDLFEIGAIKFGAFKLKLHEKFPDAPLSPIYIDLRLLRSFPSAMESAILVYRDLIKGIKFDIIADVPTAVTPIVAVLAYLTRVPMISPRKDEKTHGISMTIDGVFKAGDTVLLVDDLITKAQSKLEAITSLETSGLKMRDVVVLVDREQGGVEELSQRGYSCHSAIRLSELLECLRDTTRISDEQYRRTMSYISSN